MAGRGAAPNPDSIRNLDHKDVVPKTKVRASKVLRGQPLPENIDWHPRTLAWWDTWRRSALSETFGGTDWDFLLETALLHTAFWLGDHKLAAELRLRVGKMGATAEDRFRLHLEVTSPDVTPEAPAATSVKPKAKKSDRRTRLSMVPPISA